MVERTMEIEMLTLGEEVEVQSRGNYHQYQCNDLAGKGDQRVLSRQREGGRTAAARKAMNEV